MDIYNVPCVSADDTVLRSSTAPVLPVFSKENKPVDIKASFVSMLTSSRHTGYQAATYSMITGRDPEPRIVCSGKYLPIDAGFIYRMHGTWDVTRPSGMHFTVENYEVTDELTKEVIMRFLCSSKIKGCGEKTAERIYELYGTQTIQTLKENPEQLRNAVLPRAKTEQIIQSFRDYAKLDEIIKMLAKFGISEDIANKIYDKYGNDAINVIKGHPYQLCLVYGLGFHVADRIARVMHISADDYERFCAAARAVLLNGELSTGSTHMPYRRFLDDVFLKLYGRLPTDVSPKDRKPANDNLCQAFHERKMALHKFQGKQLISRVQADTAEDRFAEEITRLIHSKIPEITDLSSKIEKAFEEKKLQPNKEQMSAVNTALTNPVSIVTGGPGCGKTAIMQILACICEAEYGRSNVLLMAPTGRAARKLNEYTGLEAYTIHHTLQLFDTDEGTGEVGSDADIVLNNKLIVVDEASMLDIWVACKVVAAVQEGSRLVFVGDANQLQSVRAGAVFRDLVESGIVPCTRLAKIFRQKEGSLIIDNASKYLNGALELNQGEQFQIQQNTDGEEIEKRLVSAYMEAVHGTDRHEKDSVVCLCPMKKGYGGVYRMNRKLQELMNPFSPDKRQLCFRNTIYREGDLVMETKNHDDVVNGDIGYITEVSNIRYDERVVVLFDNGVEEIYTRLDLDHLVLAYAMTVHKSQGSAYDTVITSLTFENKPMLVRNLMYTAFTRAKEKVVFIGDEDALLSASFKDGGNERITLLCPKLERKSGKFVSLDA